jgi:plasmid maintenance system antidote protein VapI
MQARVVDRHRWLRDELMDKNLKQRDVARAWDVDDAVVSRFIKHGEPRANGGSP